MSSPFIELILPSLVVTLFAVGCLTVLLRKNAFQSLLGICLMLWSPVVFLAQVGARWGSAEASVFAAVLVFTGVLTAAGGFILIQWLGDSTGNVDLDA
jgi:NADH:ubiquinone oxidoreductase subunit K